MSCLTHQSCQSHYAQITSFAFGVPAPGQFSWRGRRDVRVKIGRVERQHVRRQLEMLDGRAGDLDLRILQLLISDLRSQSVKRLASKRRGWQAGYPWYRRFQKSRQMAFRRRRTGSLHCHGEHHLTHRRTVSRFPQTTGLSMSLTRSSCSATQTKAPTSPTRRVPIVRVAAKSATGGASAGPNTACRANGRWRAESHNDWEAIR